MSDFDQRRWEIEQLRTRLHQLVLEKRGNLADLEVAELSTCLDRLIVEYERAKAERKMVQAAP